MSRVIANQMDKENTIENIRTLLYSLSCGVPIDAIDFYPKEISGEIRSLVKEYLPKIKEKNK